MPDYRTIVFARNDAVATIALDRPQKLNAITDGMNEELASALDTVAADASIRVVVLKGEGRAFSAGYDVSNGNDGPEKTPAYWRHHFRLAFVTLRKLWSLPQPVICQVQGPCLGGGFAMAMASDLVYASDTAFFGDPEVKFGDGGNMFPVLQWTVGMKLLSELSLTGRFVYATEALRVGLVNEVVANDALAARVAQVAAHMCLIPEGTLQANKHALRSMYEDMGLAGFAEAREREAALNLATRTQSEFSGRVIRDGMSAALAWQKARFDRVGAFR